MTPSAPSTIGNPYVGPRPFARGENVFGRDAEIAQLADLLFAERIVLVYSPSGAGKTSLIQAGLVPRLQMDDFRVLPPIRLNLEIDRESATVGGVNRYVRSAVASLAGDVSPERLEDLARLPFGVYLDQYPRADGEPKDDVLVFDQFEELLTLDPTDSAVKREFVSQVGFALRNRHRWALFAMREEYIAGLDPYARLVPTRLATTFRLDLLKKEQALAAIIEPARNAKPSFTPDGAKTLFDQLCPVRVQRPDGWKDEPGDYVEPVQLQVACRRLWEKSQGADEITSADVVALGNVQTALADYYAENVKAIADSTNSDERAVREWFAHITEHGIRAQVLQGPAVPNSGDVLRELENVHLVRTETRRGATWYELAHDRLIEPLRRNNTAWFESNLSPFQRQARLWAQAGRSEGYLLRAAALDDAEAWIRRETKPLTKTEEEFRAECWRLREREASEQRQAQQLRQWAIAASITCVLTIGASLVAVKTGLNARQQRAIADTRALVAGSAANLERDPDLSLALAREAVAPAFKAGKTVRPEAVGALLEAVQNAAGRTRVGPLGRPGSYGAISADGRQLAAVDTVDKVVRIVDAHTLRQITSIPVPDARDIAFSPDGTRLAIASADHSASIRELPSGRPALTLTGHADEVLAVSYSDDGAKIATASKDRTAKLWDARTGVELRTFTGYAQAVTTVAFNRGASLVATGSEDGTATVWDVATGEEVRTIDQHGAAIREVAFSPDGRRLATASDDDSARFWDVATGSEAAPPQPHLGPVLAVAFSPDGRLVATGSDDGTARLSDSATGDAERVIQPGTGPVTRIAFAPDGRQLAIATAGGDLALWAAAVPFAGHAGRVTSVAFSPDGGLLASASDDRTVRLWDVASGSLIRTFRHPAEVTGVAFSPDGSLLATSAGDKLARLWDLASGALVRELSGPAALRDVAFSPKGDLLATAGEDATARLWDVASGAPVGTLAGHDAAVNGLDFSPDGAHLVTASSDKTAKVWNVADRTLERTLTGHTDFVYAAVFRPDGKEVVTTGKDRTVRFWNAASGRQTRQFAGHTEQIWDVASSADGKLVATASSDRFVVVRNLKSNSRTVRIPSIGEMTATAFSPRNGVVAAGDADGRLSVYTVDTAALIDLADQRTIRPLRPEECRIYLGKRTCPIM